MKKVFAYSFLVVLIVLVGCDGSPTLDAFQPIPQLETLDYQAVNPAQAYDYWELRFAFYDETPTVLGSGGTQAKADLPADVLAKLETLKVEFGFSEGCLPDYCFNYLVSVQGEEVKVWQTPQALLTFLGALDRVEEAVLLTDANGYYWLEDNEMEGGGFIRQVDNGYELKVLRLVSDCLPIQVNRYLLHLTRSGELSERESEVWELMPGYCI